MFPVKTCYKKIKTSSFYKLTIIAFLKIIFLCNLLITVVWLNFMSLQSHRHSFHLIRPFPISWYQAQGSINLKTKTLLNEQISIKCCFIEWFSSLYYVRRFICACFEIVFIYMHHFPLKFTFLPRGWQLTITSPLQKINLPLNWYYIFVLFSFQQSFVCSLYFYIF